MYWATHLLICLSFSIKKYAETLLDVSKKFGIEMNAEGTRELGN
jgi:hypothetical protein